MKQSHILAGVGVAMLVLFYVTSVQREGFDTSRGQFIKAIGGDDSVWFQPTGTNDKYPLSSCTLCGSENFCDSIVMKPLSVANALSTKSLFTCSMLSAPPAGATGAGATGAGAGGAGAGATGAGSACSATMLENHDAVGGDISRVSASSASECSSLCCQNSSCKKYTFFRGNCFLKDATSTAFTTFPGAVAGAVTKSETTAASAPPTPTPSSNTSTAGRTDLSSYISRIGTAEDLQKSLTDRAKSTYGSFLSVIASGIAKFGIVVIVGASIVVGVLVVWSMWNAFVGRSTTPAVPIGAPLMR